MLKLYPSAADSDRGEASGTVALGSLEAFRAITQTHQMSICGGDEFSTEKHTHTLFSFNLKGIKTWKDFSYFSTVKTEPISSAVRS